MKLKWKPLKRNLELFIQTVKNLYYYYKSYFFEVKCNETIKKQFYHDLSMIRNLKLLKQKVKTLISFQKVAILN